MPDLISVIVPVYNVEKYISECISSIIHQQYKHLEILLIDDGSTDYSGDICDEWAQKDDRIHVIHKEHEGVSVARNTGMLKCRGNFIGFVDADDWLEPEMYQVLIDRISKNDAGAIMCGYYTYPKGSEKPIKKGTLATEDGTFEETLLSIHDNDGYFTSVWNKLFRREVVFQNGKPFLMDPCISFGEDEVWLYEVLRNCKKISHIAMPLYHWRAREGSITKTKCLTDEKMSIIYAKKRALKLLPSTDAIQRKFRSMIYNEIYKLKVDAYITKDKANYEKLSEYLRPYRSDWRKSSNLRKLRRNKIELLEFCMKIRMPRAIVMMIDNLR